jgi:hypothetical protein
MLAAEIAPCVIKNLTVAQLCRLVGEYDVSRGYITTARGLKPAEKAAVCAGTAPLSHFHNQYRKNRAADRLVKKLGVECVWAAIERATAPAIAAE